MSGKCVIIAAGDGFLPEVINKDDFIICADGGYDKCIAAGLRPDLIIGDYDSASEAVSDTHACRITLPSRKDVTDLHAAAAEAMNRGFKRFVLTGCAGGRLDHSLGAICVLEYLSQYGNDAYIADYNNIVYVQTALTRKYPRINKFKYFSVIPLDMVIKGVTLDGVLYPLANAVIERNQTLGISNEITSDSASVTISEGRALVIYSRD